MDVTSTSHSNDPPTIHNGQNVIEGAIDPSLVEPVIAASASVPDDEQSLKRTWITLLPVEQVIDIVMKLDENVPLNVRKEVWPTDLKVAVFQAAVARIMESSGRENETLKTSKSSNSTFEKERIDGTPKEVQSSVETVPSPEPVPSLPSSTTTTTADAVQLSRASSATPLRTTTPAHAPSAVASPIPAPSTTPVPPLTTTVPVSSPATSTTTYQAASSSYSYPYPYSSGSYSYQHSANHQPYSYSYSPTAGSTSYSPAPPPRVPPAPGTIPAVEEDEDLPSYEEMLVQALTVYNEPDGTAPKQLFQWMAATYPLQANFRPSASQALQKAFKRGRFEKNKEGKYRLNADWEGGSTSKRTTRRPQSYSKSVTNPSPSSHPPPNPSQYPPQHYTWTYGAARSAKSQSMSPAPPQITPALQSSEQPRPAPEATALHTQDDVEQESHRSCMEAAYSILQALNLTSALDGLKTGESTTIGESHARDSGNITVHNGMIASLSSHDAGICRAPVVAGDFTLPNHLTDKDPTSSTLPNSHYVEAYACGSDTIVQSASARAALQGSLALLAAQLAELADDVDSGAGKQTSTSDLPASADVSVNSASNAVNLLEGLDLEMFNASSWADLRGVDVGAKH